MALRVPRFLTEIVAIARSQMPQRLGSEFRSRGRTDAGVYVSEDTAMTCSAYFACISVIAQSIAAMPWQVIAKKEKNREPQENTVSWLLSTQPNPEMTAFTFRETMLSWALGWGNGYAEIERDAGRRPIWLWPIAPDRVTAKRSDSGKLVYEVRNETTPTTVLAAEDMMHIRGLGFDGLTGYSVARLAAQSIGLALGMEQFGASFFGSGAHMAGALQHPKQLTKAAAERLRESWDETYNGLKKAHKVAILEEGMTYNRFGIPPDEAQFLESRQFQIEEICRWFRMPPHKVQHLLRATFSNIEHQSIDFVTDTLLPWVVRLEQEANIKLVGRNTQGRLITKINMNALLRGDTSTRNAAYAQGRQWGWLSANDVREKEDMNPLPEGGDVYLSPANMVPADELGKTPAPQYQTAPAQKPAAPAPGEEETEPKEPGTTQRRAVYAVCFETSVRVVRREAAKYKQLAKACAGDGPKFAEDAATWIADHRGYVLDQMRQAVDLARLILGASPAPLGAFGPTVTDYVLRLGEDFQVSFDNSADYTIEQRARKLADRITGECYAVSGQSPR